MAMLLRYKKTGGFIQLLKLIETCGPKKKEQLIKMVDSEDPRWSKALKEKMLTIDKIFSWNESTLSEIVVRIQELSLGVALHGRSDEDWVKVSKSLSHSQIRRIEGIKRSKEPTAAEISSAFMKIIEEVRDMITTKQLNAESFAPELMVSEDIEEYLSKQSFVSTTPDPSNENLVELQEGATLDFSKTEVADKNTTPSSNTNLTQIQNELAFLRKENSHLKQELNSVKNKMSQLKKIIAA